MSLPVLAVMVCIGFGTQRPCKSSMCLKTVNPTTLNPKTLNPKNPKP